MSIPTNRKSLLLLPTCRVHSASGAGATQACVMATQIDRSYRDSSEVISLVLSDCRWSVWNPFRPRGDEFASLGKAI